LNKNKKNKKRKGQIIVDVKGMLEMLRVVQSDALSDMPKERRRGEFLEVV